MIETLEFVSYNGVTLPLNDDVTPMLRFEHPADWRFEEVERPQEWGIFPTNSLVGKRVIRCEGEILVDGAAEYTQKRIQMFRALMPYSALTRQAIGKLRILFTGMDEFLTAECTLDSYPELPLEAMQPARGHYLIAFKSFDPRYYGEQTRLATLYPSVQAVGRAYAKTYPYGYTIGTPGGSDIVVTNSGNVDTFVKARFNGPATNPQLTIFTAEGAQSFLLNGLALTATDYVDVEFTPGHRTAVLNGTTNVFDLAVDSVWWALPPGNSVLRFSAFSSVAPAHVDVTWNNAYML